MKAILLLAIMGCFASVSAHAGCQEGSILVETEEDANDNTIRVRRTCVNGSYMTAKERAAYVRNPSSTCQEGAFLRSEEYHRGRTYRVTYVCVNGRYEESRRSRTGSSND